MGPGTGGEAGAGEVGASMSLSVISDMDGVIYRGKQIIPGAQEFIDRMSATGTPFLFLTNNSEQTQLDLVHKLRAMGVRGLEPTHFITSAMATAQFVASQRPGGSAYVLGGAGLATELHKVGYSLTERDPDFVVVGKTRSFSFESLAKAVALIRGGARFIGTNPDILDPVEGGVEPAAGAILAAVAAAAGVPPYVVGKPNSLMMIYARQMLDAHAEDCVMVGDRMDTDVVGGMEAGMKTCLVLSGVTAREDLKRFPYRPTFVYPSVAEVDLAELAGPA